MIPSHELKINNWVNFFWQNDMPLEFLRLCPDEFSVRVIDEECKRLSPIPLTPEILEGCGFEKENVWFCNRNIDIKMLDNIYEVYINEILTKVQSLHQLQNLYFALTGEELTVKLPVTA